MRELIVKNGWLKNKSWILVEIEEGKYEIINGNHCFVV